MGTMRFDQETKDRALRLYYEAVAEEGATKIGARRKIGGMLDINPATLNNWILKAEKEAAASSLAAEQDKDAEIARLRKEVKQLTEANEILRLASGFFRPGGARPQTKIVVEFLHAHRHLYSIERMCQVLNEHQYQISPATYYRYQARNFGPTDAELDEAYEANRLYDLWVANRRVYGRRKLWKAAKRAGWDIGRGKVNRLMTLLGISGVLRRKSTRTTVANPNNPRFADHCKRAWESVERPDQWWVADFTYVYTKQGFCYVAFVTDVYSRRILGYSVAESKTTEFILSALRQAISLRSREDPNFSPVGVIHHSDAGSQYTSAELRGLIAREGMTGSIGTVGDAYDNGLMESTIGLYKSEEIDFEGRKWSNWQEVEAATASWVSWYNTERLHGSIDYIPPKEHEMWYRLTNPNREQSEAQAA
ncbi:IS3 family transposase [Corynebacterium lizhenjunii]|uniref:IS3 family transposase n=1 Tax=Corynebacterium lizhenjunii TaxID=2709394 RepID=A0A7T0KHP8_9CORY|nr:IS3 family transposase [Corynebacterium lizhenjunii]QPK80104.1 IS3 family transposase [Corynebacterium lizhenjunii]